MAKLHSSHTNGRVSCGAGPAVEEREGVEALRAERAALLEELRGLREEMEIGRLAV